MKVPVFFLSLFIVLVSGNASLFARDCFSIQYQSASLNTNLKAVKNNHISNDYIFFTNLSQSEEYKILLCEEIEDKNSIESSSRKGRLDNGFLSIFSDQYRLDYFYRFIKAIPFIWRNASNRYILQRALRI